jgi:hypothetical protein
MRSILFMAMLSVFTVPAVAQTTPSAAAKQSSPTGKTKDTLTKVNAGAKLALNMSQMNGDQTFKESYLTGVAGGGYLEATRNLVGIKVEGMINYQQYELQDTVFGGGKIKTLNLDIPLLFKVRILPMLWVELGPQVSTLLSVDQEPTGIKNPKSFFESSNFSGVIGLDAKIQKRITLGARYVLGLANINNSGGSFSSQQWKANSVQLYAGFKLN